MQYDTVILIINKFVSYMPLVALGDFYGLTKVDVPTRKMVISEPLYTIADRN
jgi:hypothetical protein